MKLIHCADIHLDSPMQTHMTARQARFVTGNFRKI